MNITLIGRPNVGKSAIFNRLVGQKLAIVHDVNGVTRDRKYSTFNLYDVECTLIDTPGVDPFSKEQLAKDMNNQSQLAILDSDIILFVYDIRDGMTEYDKAIADWIRVVFRKNKVNKTVITLGNKCENTRNILKDTANFGFGEPVYISAEHNLGFSDLIDIMLQHYENHNCIANCKVKNETVHNKNKQNFHIDSQQNSCVTISNAENNESFNNERVLFSLGKLNDEIVDDKQDSYKIDFANDHTLNNEEDKDIHNEGYVCGIENNIYEVEDDVEVEDDICAEDDEGELTSEFDAKHDVIKVAIIGRPNVGKSTLVNKFLNEERLLTGPIAGLTRDSITCDFEYKDIKFKLTDTAGQKKKAQDILDKISYLDTYRYIRQSHAVILVVDVDHPFEKQDIKIAQAAYDEGKILIIAINKCDKLEQFNQAVTELRKKLKYAFFQLPNVECIGISAMYGRNINKLLDAITEFYEKWSLRIPTSMLNRVFREIVERKAPPVVGGRAFKLKYISQTNTKPPSFTIFANQSNELPQHYYRYIKNQLTEIFALEKIPIRIYIRCRENPYKKK